MAVQIDVPSHAVVNMEQVRSFWNQESGIAFAPRPENPLISSHEHCV